MDAAGLERKVEQDNVEVVAAEFGDSLAAQDFVVALDEVDHRRIERAAAEIGNDQSLALRRSAAARQVMGVLDARRRRLVHHQLRLEARAAERLVRDEWLDAV